MLTYPQSHMVHCFWKTKCLDIVLAFSRESVYWCFLQYTVYISEQIHVTAFQSGRIRQHNGLTIWMKPWYKYIYWLYSPLHINENPNRKLKQYQLEIVDQWSTRIPPPHRRGWQWAMGGLQLNIVYNHKAAILKVTSLKINRLLPIYISIVPLKLAVDIQSQTKVRVRKPKIPIWPPGGHFESDLAENQ